MAGSAYRHGWIAGRSRRPDAATADCIGHLDLASGRRSLFQLPDGDATSEPIFVPRSAASDEGDGWLLAVVHRARENVSDLVVLDARDVASGPVATASVPRRVPHGFHGNWVAN